jgi:hypothetical protein
LLPSFGASSLFNTTDYTPKVRQWIGRTVLELTAIVPPTKKADFMKPASCYSFLLLYFIKLVDSQTLPALEISANQPDFFLRARYVLEYLYFVMSLETLR